MNLRSTIVDLRPDHLATVNAILLAEIPDYEVWAFGSRANWTAKDSSDLDLAIASNEPVPAKRLRRLQRAFEESYLPLKVDVVDLSRASPEFRGLIEKQRVVLRKPETDGAANHPTDRDWRSLPLEEAVETIIDYRGKTPRKVTQGIPLITAKIIKGGRIETPEEFISPDDYDEWMRRGIPSAGDVLLTTEAPLGEVAQLDERKVALAQRVVALRGKKGLLDNDFLKYLLQSGQVQDQLKSRASGTTVQGIKQSELRKISLSIPPLDQQRAIAHTLGLLDKKIELNRRMNETLEAVAEAHFKSSFETLTQNDIPEGWQRLTIGEACEFAYGKALKEGMRQRGSIPVYGSNGQIGWHDEALAKGPGIVVGRKGNPGVITWVPTDFFPIDTTFYVVPRRQCRSLYFLFYALAAQNLPSLGADSAVPGLNRNVAYLSRLLIPPSELLNRFDEKVRPLFGQIHSNSEESRTLAELRDSLLPKLLSGELRIKDAERIIGEQA